MFQIRDCLLKWAYCEAVAISGLSQRELAMLVLIEDLQTGPVTGTEVAEITRKQPGKSMIAGATDRSIVIIANISQEKYNGPLIGPLKLKHLFDLSCA